MHLRFFTPNDKFMPWLKAQVKKTKLPVVECGCGYGDLLLEMHAEGIPAMGLDPRYDMFNEAIPEAVSSAILPVQAEYSPIVRNKPALLLVCRPCHSGFPMAINCVRHLDSKFYYVGLERNLEIDWDEGTKLVKLTKEPVGLEGEHIWQVYK